MPRRIIFIPNRTSLDWYVAYVYRFLDSFHHRIFVDPAYLRDMVLRHIGVSCHAARRRRHSMCCAATARTFSEDSQGLRRLCLDFIYAVHIFLNSKGLPNGDTINAKLTAAVCASSGNQPCDFLR